jgi:hypothetical protein
MLNAGLMATKQIKSITSPENMLGENQRPDDRMYIRQQAGSLYLADKYSNP